MRYLLLTFIKKPNGQIDEQCGVSTKIRNSDRSTCNIILDYHDRKIEKCVVDGRVLDTTWDLINDYYKKVYPALIEQLESSSPNQVAPSQSVTESPEQQNGA
jgi:hypothetical protein